MSTVLRDQGGQEIRGFLASGRPESLVIVHDIFGLTGQIRKAATQFATIGFTVFAIDLFDGVTTDDEAKGFNLAQRLSWSRSIQRIRAAFDSLRAMGGADAKTAVLGFGLGGGVSLATASHVTTVSACVSFYGIPGQDKADLLRISCPVQGHFGNQDKRYTKDRVDALEAKLKSVGIAAEFHRYHVGHFFYDETRKQTYSPHNSDLAFHRTFPFLKRSMGATW